MRSGKQVVFLLASILCACGGGGSGGSSSAFFAGIWSGTSRQIHSTCGFNTPGGLSFTYTVNQEDQKIVLDGQNGATFVGRVSDDNKGFTVTRSHPELKDYGPFACVTDVAIKFDQVDGDQAGQVIQVLVLVRIYSVGTSLEYLPEIDNNPIV